MGVGSRSQGETRDRRSYNGQSPGLHPGYGRAGEERFCDLTSMREARGRARPEGRASRC